MVESCKEEKIPLEAYLEWVKFSLTTVSFRFFWADLGWVGLILSKRGEKFSHHEWSTPKTSHKMAFQKELSIEMGASGWNHHPHRAWWSGIGWTAENPGLHPSHPPAFPFNQPWSSWVKWGREIVQFPVGFLGLGLFLPGFQLREHTRKG
jgi:hypothetical protein